MLGSTTRKSVENHGHPTVAVNQFQENLDLEHRIVQQNTLVLIKIIDQFIRNIARPRLTWFQLVRFSRYHGFFGGPSYFGTNLGITRFLDKFSGSANILKNHYT